MPGWDSYSQAVAADGPTAYWRLGELAPFSNGMAQDSSSGTNDPLNLQTLNYGANVGQGGPCLTATRGGSPHDCGASLPLTATNSTANTILSNGRMPGIESAALSVECWVQPITMNAGGSQNIASYNAGGGGWNMQHSGGSASTHSATWQLQAGGTRTISSAAGSILSGIIYHLVGTFNGTVQNLYINGVLAATATIAQTAVTYGGTSGLGIGSDYNISSSNLQGNVDEVSVYSYALPAARVLYHYQEGSRFLPINWRH